MAEKRVNYSSGAPLEEKVGYSRMVKVGDHIYVGGTTSVQPDGTVYGENAYEQTRYVLEKQVKLIEQAGAGVGDVIKVKILEVDSKRKRISLTMKDINSLFNLCSIKSDLSKNEVGYGLLDVNKLLSI